jgi:hypothetical protein
MKTSTTLGVAFGTIILAIFVLFFEAGLLSVILSWFGVNLSFHQNLAIVFLANLIFKNTEVSSK